MGTKYNYINQSLEVRGSICKKTKVSINILSRHMLPTPSMWDTGIITAMPPWYLINKYFSISFPNLNTRLLLLQSFRKYLETRQPQRPLAEAFGPCPEIQYHTDALDPIETVFELCTFVKYF